MPIIEETYKFIRNLRSPITEQMLRPLDPECRVVQFCEPLTEDDFRKLSRFLEVYPEVPLRIYGHYGEAADLSFLRHFPFLRGFQADLYRLTDIDGLAFLPEGLEFLALGQTKRRMSLKPLARFKKLRDLYPEGHTKDFSVVSELDELIYLSLRSITLPDLTPLLPLRLRSLALRLGGTKNLALLPRLSELRFLFLQALKNVTELPSFVRLDNLVRCHLDGIKGLTDLCPIASARNLQELLVTSVRQIRVADLNCFRGHPTLRGARFGLGSLRRSAETSKLLDLPDVPYFRPIKQYVETD